MKLLPGWAGPVNKGEIPSVSGNWRGSQSARVGRAASKEAGRCDRGRGHAGGRGTARPAPPPDGSGTATRSGCATGGPPAGGPAAPVGGRPLPVGVDQPRRVVVRVVAD